MIYDTQSLKSSLSKYSNINQKINLEVKSNKLTRIKRGVFSDNPKIDGPILANVCYGPSYISFEYALSYYGLIPEKVSVYTSATFGKKNKKIFKSSEVFLSYEDVPEKVFPYGISFLKTEDGNIFKIATKEKSLCDTIYKRYPVRNIKNIKLMLHSDLRIDEYELKKLDLNFIKQIVPLYHCNSLNYFVKYLGELFNENNN